MTLWIVALVFALVGQGSAPSAKADPLFSARHLSCTFSLYAAPLWKDGAITGMTHDEEFTFDVNGIDKKNNAQIVASNGASAHASTITTGTGLNVIEATPSGNLNVTTIFVGGKSGGKYLAVHSRHLGDPAAPPTVSQHYGTCTIVQ
jgi:hypothetical protein